MGNACMSVIGGVASEGKAPSSINLAGEAFQRLKENFDAPFGEVYDVRTTRQDWDPAQGKQGIEMSFGNEGQCMKNLITGVKPDGPAHRLGVAPGTKILKINDVPASLDAYVAEKNKFQSGDVDALTLTLERPAFGHVVAKNGPNAGRPTISTWKAMGLKWEDIAEKYGKSSMHELSSEEYCYFHETLQRMIHFACSYPGWGKDGAARLFDAPFWESKCSDDGDFQSNLARLKGMDDGRQAWCPLDCDDVGLPFNESKQTHTASVQFSGHVPMSARFGKADKLINSEMPYWDRYNKLYKSLDTLRYKSASTCLIRNQSAAKAAQKKVYIVPEADVAKVKNGNLQKYWEHEVKITEASDANLYVQKVNSAPTCDGEWQMVNSKEEADICVQLKDAAWSSQFVVKWVDPGEYKGVCPAGSASGPMMFYEQIEDKSCR